MRCSEGEEGFGRGFLGDEIVDGEVVFSLWWERLLVFCPFVFLQLIGFLAWFFFCFGFGGGFLLFDFFIGGGFPSLFRKLPKNCSHTPQTLNLSP